MKKSLIVLISVIIIVAACGGYVQFQFGKAINDPLKIKEEYIVVVDNQEGLYSVLDKLYKEKIIINPYLIKYSIKKNNIGTGIKPGKHVIYPQSDLVTLIQTLNKAVKGQDEIEVTIKEGKNIDEIAKILDEKGIIDKEAFLEGCKNYQLPKYVNKNSERRYALEGYLFPDTYRFKKNVDVNLIIKTMSNRFEEVVKEVYGENEINYEKLDDIITIASIVEKEVQTAEERELVSSVIYNRLKKNMLIQCDPTVLYALGEHKEKVLYKDLEVDSLYNTYKYKGLPIGPICSPGKASISAALHPSETNYIYFVANNDGTHFFTNDYNEFLRVKKVTQGF